MNNKKGARRQLALPVALLLAGIPFSDSQASSCLDRFHSAITLVNETPFALRLVGNCVAYNRSSPRSHFTFHFTFSEELDDKGYRLEPGAAVFAGSGTSWADTSTVGGYLTVEVEPGDASFDIAYQLGHTSDHHNRVRLINNDPGKPLPPLCVQSASRWQQQQRFPWFVPIDATDYTNDCTISLTQQEDFCPVDPHACLDARQNSADLPDTEREQPPPDHSDAPCYTSCCDDCPACCDCCLLSSCGGVRGGLYLELSFVNETPFALKLTGHTTERADSRQGIFPLRFKNTFQSGMIPAGAELSGVATLKYDMVQDNTLAETFTFQRQETNSSFCLTINFIGAIPCHPPH